MANFDPVREWMDEILAKRVLFDEDVRQLAYLASKIGEVIPLQRLNLNEALPRWERFEVGGDADD